MHRDVVPLVTPVHDQTTIIGRLYFSTGVAISLAKTCACHESRPHVVTDRF
eukprot:m.1652324 g.1652324  ORF g.1652324 m.1652324 type:complete len:51 (-) comp92883_c0_seq1:16-168(-)